MSAPRGRKAAGTFPDCLVNVKDLDITRPTSTGEFGNVVAGGPARVLDKVEAIVERRKDFTRLPDDETVTLVADIWIRPPAADDQARVQEKDLASWTDSYGTVSNAEVVAIVPAQVGDETLGIRLRVGRR